MRKKLEQYIQLSINIYKQQSIVEKKYNKIFEELRITFQQFLFIYLIDYLCKDNVLDLATSTDIIERMGIGRAGISRLGSRIESLGLIKRNIKGTRTVTYELTTEGKRVLENCLDLISNDEFASVKVNQLNLLNFHLEDISKNI